MGCSLPAATVACVGAATHVHAVSRWKGMQTRYMPREKEKCTCTAMRDDRDGDLTLRNVRGCELLLSLRCPNASLLYTPRCRHKPPAALQHIYHCKHYNT